MKKIMKKINYAGAIVLVLGVIACNPLGSFKMNSENLQKVKIGMSEKEVKGLLGSPTSITTGETLGIRGTTFHYKKGGSEVEVVFLNDGVITKSGEFK